MQNGTSACLDIGDQKALTLEILRNPLFQRRVTHQILNILQARRDKLQTHQGIVGQAADARRRLFGRGAEKVGHRLATKGFRKAVAPGELAPLLFVQQQKNIHHLRRPKGQRDDKRHLPHEATGP